MATIQWRPEVNALTVPQSYRPRFLPRNVIGYDELAAEIARDNPNYNEVLVKAILIAATYKIKEQLINGNQVTLEDAFSYRLSFHARRMIWTPPCRRRTICSGGEALHASRPFIKDGAAGRQAGTGGHVGKTTAYRLG